MFYIYIYIYIYFFFFFIDTACTYKLGYTDTKFALICTNVLIEFAV